MEEEKTGNKKKENGKEKYTRRRASFGEEDRTRKVEENIPEACLPFHR